MAQGAPPDYVDVATRIVEFRERYPDGCLRPADPSRPYTIETVGDRTFVVVVAAAFRTPDDPAPGVGMAWEPFPGPTNFTRDSELQNAETSAWGRAIIAVGAADAKKGVASADEVRNRRSQPVDLSQVAAAIAEAQSLGIQGDYDGTREYAAQSQANADAAASKLRKAIAKKRAEAQGPPADDAPSGDQPADDGKPAWQQQAEAEGISLEQLLIGLQKAWPSNDQASKPTRTSGLATVADRHEGLFARVIEDLAREKREDAA